jgi:uncharacterized lipoprotein
MTKTSTRLAAGIAVVGVLILAGCSSVEDQKADTTDSSSSSAAASSPEAAAAQDAVD